MYVANVLMASTFEGKMKYESSSFGLSQVRKGEVMAAVSSL